MTGALQAHPALWLLALFLLLLPAFASNFVLVEIFGWAMILGMIALSLMFLAGYGGMVSLVQMTVAGCAGYMVAIFGTSAVTEISLGWPWWIGVPVAIVIAVIFGTLSGALAVRTEGIYTIMITLAIASAFYYFTQQNYTIFNGFQRLQRGAHAAGVRRRVARADAVLLSHPVLGRGRLPGRRLRLALAVRACPAGHPRQRPAHGGARLQRHRAPHRGLRLRGADRGSRRRAAGLARRPDLARHRRRRSGGRHPHHRGGGRTEPADRAFIGALIYVILRTFALDVLEAVGLDGKRFQLLIGLGFLLIVLFSPDGVLGLWARLRERLLRPNGTRDREDA